MKGSRTRAMPQCFAESGGPVLSFHRPLGPRKCSRHHFDFFSTTLYGSADVLHLVCFRFTCADSHARSSEFYINAPSIAVAPALFGEIASRRVSEVIMAFQSRASRPISPRPGSSFTQSRAGEAKHATSAVNMDIYKPYGLFRVGSVDVSSPRKMEMLKSAAATGLRRSADECVFCLELFVQYIDEVPFGLCLLGIVHATLFTDYDDRHAFQL